jgi:recombination protein RecA
MGRKPKIREEQLKETTDTFLDAIVEKFGDNVLSNIRGDKVEAMTSGSLSLDASIGIGGFPRGRFTEIVGAEGTGKTTEALTAALLEIDNGGKVLYVDAENMLSYAAIEQMLSKQVNKDRFILVQPETAEQAFMITEKAITSGEFTFIVIDSVAALEPQDEKEKEFDEFTMASLSRLLAKFFRRNAADVKNQNVAVLLLNQVRDKIGSYTGGYESPGGHALKHYASVRIALTKGTEIKQGEEKIGINTKFVIKKNKLSAPFRSFEIPIIFGRGVDYYSDAVSFCETLGIIKKNGAFYKFEGSTLGQGRNAAAQYLRENSQILDKIKEQLYNVLNKQTNLMVEDEEDVE